MMPVNNATDVALLITLLMTSHAQLKKVNANHVGSHYSRVCKSSAKSVNEESLPEVTFTLATSPTSDMLVDTGSGVSIQPEKLYRENFSTSKLSPPIVKLLTYLRQNLKVFGRLKATVTYQQRTATGFQRCEVWYTSHWAGSM